MKLIPNSTARRTTRMASARSAGSPQIPLPVIRIAPYPSRAMRRSFPIRNSPAFPASPFTWFVVDIVFFLLDLSRASVNIQFGAGDKAGIVGSEEELGRAHV